MSDPTLLVLSSLAGGDKHGYAMMDDIERFAGVRLGPGTLYGAITRLEERGWIAPCRPHGSPSALHHYRSGPSASGGAASALAGPCAPASAVGTHETPAEVPGALYPAAWRQRYGTEFEALLDDRPARARDAVDVAWGGLQMQDEIMGLRSNRLGVEPGRLHRCGCRIFRHPAALRLQRDHSRNLARSCGETAPRRG